MIDLRSMRLGPGDVRHERPRVAVAPLTIAGQEYTVTPAELEPRLDLQAASGGLYLKLAERQAHELVEQARAKERETRLGAEDYADGILENLEVNLGKFLAAVQRGREQLASRDGEGTGPGTAGFDTSG